MRDVSDMHAHLVITVGELAERNSIVEVFSIGRVDCKGENISEILADLDLFRGDGLRDAVGRVLHFGREAVGQVEFRQDGVHLGFILTGSAKNIHQMAEGIHLPAIPAVYHHRDLHAALRSHGRSRFGVDLDIIGHVLALHQHPCLGANGVKDAHELTSAALQHVDDFAFAAMTESLLPGAVVAAGHAVAGDGHANGVAVKGTAGLVRGDVHVVVLTVDDYKDETVARHANGSGFLGHYALPGSLAVVALERTLVAFTHASSRTSR